MSNRKANALLYACEIAPKIGNYVEIGCIRELKEVPQDGFSSIYLAKYCLKHNLKCWSVDIQIENVQKTYAALEQYSLNNLNVVCQDGEEFLNDWYVENLGQISFLYLDSHRDPQYTLNQFEAARDKLCKNAVVAIDDAQPYDRFNFGKASYVIPILDKEKIPFKLINTEPGFKTVVFTL